MTIRFYGVDINKPLSLANNNSGWDQSVLGQLYAKTEGKVYLREVPQLSRKAQFCWRVVSAEWSAEDDIMTYFRAYDLDGTMLPQASFGVTYASVPSRIAGSRFTYPPEGGSRYYVPAQNDFATPNDGGYAVQVLDLENPSEGMGFGMHKAGDQHQTLVISFRLFPMAVGYPNDLPSAGV